MKDRIKKLRQQCLDTPIIISGERAELITDFYKNHVDSTMPVPVQRALAFQHILRQKKICIVGDELIVGERGPSPRAVPTYPEISLHSIEDLNILDSREKVAYKVSPEVRKLYADLVIPFWKGKSQRERLMENLDQEWHEAYNAGIFTEFQEQRTPGHTVAGMKIYSTGVNDMIREISELLEDCGDNDGQLKAMKIAGEAIVEFAGRYSDELLGLAREECREKRRNELLEMAEICRKVPACAPHNFHEALQYYWFMHIGVITESNPWDSFNPGRLDQHLFPFYDNEIRNGSLTREDAKELLQSFWIKFNNHPAPPKVGVTALESNTYTDFSLINLGGLKEDGANAVNDLSYLILEVIEEMRILQPSSMIQISEKNPNEFIHKALKIIKTGFGQPSVFNTDMIVKELVRQGKDLIDARNGGASGCVESGAFGTESYILTGYFNLTKVLEVTLNDGVDPESGKFIGIKTGNPALFAEFEDLMQAYRQQLEYFLEIKMKGNRMIDSLFADFIPVPFLSLMIDDCISNGKDYNRGGARYNTSYIQGVGLGSITDSLTAIKYHVFDHKKLSLQHMISALRKDFVNDPDLRHELIYNTPKYGNDDDFADQQAIRVFEMFFSLVDGKPAYKPGSVFRINMLPTTSHVYFGSVLGATPDGRKSGKPLSEGISPFQGMDIKGPTSVIKSASKIDHSKTGGTLLNQKFSPDFFKDKRSLEKLTALIRSYFRLGGHHIQFNVVDADTLREAQNYPENHKDLIVRVAGYSDYFNDLGKDLQDEIIRRTEHCIT